MGFEWAVPVARPWLGVNQSTGGRTVRCLNHETSEEFGSVYSTTYLRIQISGYTVHGQTWMSKVDAL